MRSSRLVFLNVSHEHRCVYLAPPRTGTRCAFAALRRFGFEGDRRRRDGVHSHVIAVPPECVGYAVIMTVRNPYTRAVSCWRWVRATHGWPTVVASSANRGFCQFVERVICTGYFPSLSAQLGSLEPDTFLRFESLQEDINTLPFVLGHVDVSFITPEPCAQYYGDDEVELVRCAWREDFVRFDYSAESLSC